MSYSGRIVTRAWLFWLSLRYCNIHRYHSPTRKLCPIFMNEFPSAKLAAIKSMRFFFYLVIINASPPTQNWLEWLGTIILWMTALMRITSWAGPLNFPRRDSRDLWPVACCRCSHKLETTVSSPLTFPVVHLVNCQSAFRKWFRQ